MLKMRTGIFTGKPQFAKHHFCLLYTSLARASPPPPFKLRPGSNVELFMYRPSVAIKYMKSSTYESIRIGRFVFGSTVPFYPTGLAG